GGLDGRARTRRGGDALQHDLPRDLALVDDLRALGVGRHQLGLAQRGEVDGVALDQRQLVEHDLRGVGGLLRPEADLRQAHVHGHLAALEAGLDLALARARERALVAAAGGLAQAGADAAADALALGARAVGRLECVELHLDYSSTRTR